MDISSVQQTPFETHSLSISNAKKIVVLTGVITLGAGALAVIMSILQAPALPWALFATHVIGVGGFSLSLIHLYRQYENTLRFPRFTQALSDCGENWEAGRKLLEPLSEKKIAAFVSYLDSEGRGQNVALKQFAQFCQHDIPPSPRTPAKFALNNKKNHTLSLSKKTQEGAGDGNRDIIQ